MPDYALVGSECVALPKDSNGDFICPEGQFLEVQPSFQNAAWMVPKCLACIPDCLQCSDTWSCDVCSGALVSHPPAYSSCEPLICPSSMINQVPNCRHCITRDADGYEAAIPEDAALSTTLTAGVVYEEALG